MSEGTVDLATQLERAVIRQDTLREGLAAKFQAQEEQIDIRLRGLGALALLDSAVDAGDIVVNRSPRIVEPEPGRPGFTDTNFGLRNDMRRSGVVRRYADVGRIGIIYWETNFPNLDLRVTHFDAVRDGKTPVKMWESKRGAPRLNLEITYDAIDRLAGSIESLSPVSLHSMQEETTSE